MRVVFLGTSAFARPALRKLAREDEVLLVCPPDRPAGRKLRPEPSPAKRLALELGLEVFQPERLNRRALERLALHRPDVLAVAASSFFLGPRGLSLAPLGAFNAHPSLLPRHRGPSPIQGAILDGDAETGVTVIRMTGRLDAGPVVAQERARLDGTETSGALEAKLAKVAAELLVGVLRGARDGRLEEREQEEARASYTRKIEKTDGLIDWSVPADAVERHVRAYDPWPTAYTFLLGGKLAITRARLAGGTGEPGKVLAGSEGKRLVVACGEGAIEALEVHPAGKRRMAAMEYLRGRRLPTGLKAENGLDYRAREM